MRYFCLTERPVKWRLPSFMEVVSTVPAGSRVTDLGKRYPDLARRGSALGVYATLFAVRRLLQDSWPGDQPPPHEELVGIAHHDRFAVTGRAGTLVGAEQLVGPEDFRRLPDEIFLPQTTQVLCPTAVPLPVTVIADHHGRYHVRDLLHFLGIAIELGVVADQNVSTFLGQPMVIPAVSVGVYPTAWLVQALELIERVVDRYESTDAVAREGRQLLGLGACCEILHMIMFERLVAALPAGGLAAAPPVVVSQRARARAAG